MVKPADENETPQNVVPAAPEAPKLAVQNMVFEDYSFQVNTDLIDDVDAVDLIDLIENQQSLKAIVDFLQYLLGKDGYEELKAHFVKKEGRFRLSKLGELYSAIFAQFDPKG